MSLLSLPIDQTDAFFGFSCELDGIAYSFSFRWNQRIGAWFMTVGDGEGTDIVSGVRIVLSLDLLAHYNNVLLPPGRMYAFDTTGSNVDAGFEDLGRRVVVLYDEVTA